jgi:hypothetical protein
MGRDPKLTIQDDVLTIKADGVEREVSIYSLEGFELLSRLWVKSGWHHHYSYTFMDGASDYPIA